MSDRQSARFDLQLLGADLKRDENSRGAKPESGRAGGKDPRIGGCDLRAEEADRRSGREGEEGGRSGSEAQNGVRNAAGAASANQREGEENRVIARRRASNDRGELCDLRRGDAGVPNGDERSAEHRRAMQSDRCGFGAFGSQYERRVGVCDAEIDESAIAGE